MAQPKMGKAMRVKGGIPKPRTSRTHITPPKMGKVKTK